MASLRTSALHSYRHLLKSILYTFHGDSDRICKGFALARDYYTKFAKVKEEDKIKQLIFEAEDAAQFMKTNIIQGVYDKNTGKCAVKPSDVNGVSAAELAPITTETMEQVKYDQGNLVMPKQL